MRVYRKVVTIWATLSRVQAYIAGQNPTVKFWFTKTVDVCAFAVISEEADDITKYGGVCAYRDDIAKVYSCPAPNNLCWRWSDPCDSITNTTSCSLGSSVWCCNASAGETCSTDNAPFCMSSFSSPNAGKDVDTANQMYLDSIDETQVTATSTVSPSFFATRTFSSETSSGVVSTNAYGYVTTVISQPQTTISTTFSTGKAMASSTSESPAYPKSSSTSSSKDASSSYNTNSTSSSSLSPNVTAGIIFGAIVIFVICAIVVYIFHRRSKETEKLARIMAGEQSIPADDPDPWPIMMPTAYASNPSNMERLGARGFYGDQIFRHELGDGTLDERDRNNTHNTTSGGGAGGGGGTCSSSEGEEAVELDGKSQQSLKPLPEPPSVEKRTSVRLSRQRHELMS